MAKKLFDRSLDLTDKAIGQHPRKNEKRTRVSIDIPDVIDAIGIDRETGEVILTISDHLEWEKGYEEHSSRLEAKIGQYLNFIISGQLFVDYPDGLGRKIRIDIVQKYPPDEQGHTWLHAAKCHVETQGYSLSWRTFRLN
jgi:hypothetical protein